jgi:thioredoxin-related protein
LKSTGGNKKPDYLDEHNIFINFCQSFFLHMINQGPTQVTGGRPNFVSILHSIISVMMKLLLIAVFSFIHPIAIHWQNDFSKAKQMAAASHKFILLNFSGSDWCGPCIRMHKEIFESDEFVSVANEQLILVNADFPRQKKNQLPKTQQAQNEKLADIYNAGGAFPYTVLLNADGKLIKAWDGFPKQGAASFTGDINQAIHAVK